MCPNWNLRSGLDWVNRFQSWPGRADRLIQLPLHSEAFDSISLLSGRAALFFQNKCNLWILSKWGVLNEIQTQHMHTCSARAAELCRVRISCRATTRGVSQKKVSLAALRTDRTDTKEGALCSPAHIYVYLNPPILSKKNKKNPPRQASKVGIWIKC